MRFLITLLTVLTTAQLLADTDKIRPSWSGAWFNPEHSGHGIVVEVLDDERTIFFWHTYDQDGNPIWLIADGVNEDIALTGMFIPHIRVEATAYYCEGMVYGEFDPATNNCQVWGSMILDFPYRECNRAHLEWFPGMEGYTQGATELERLTSLYELDCVEQQGLDGTWEVQFGYDAEVSYQVEVVATPNPETEMTDLLFNFLGQDDCQWSGEIFSGWGLISAEWSNHCGENPLNHSGDGRMHFEHKLCNSESECVRKDEVLIFKDEGEFLIFSR